MEVAPNETTPMKLTELESLHQEPPAVSLVDPDETSSELETREVAYVIKDKAFPDFAVYKSANAWWMEVAKVNDIIKAYKKGANDRQACAYAGISEKQLHYFRAIHPEFCNVSTACKSLMGLKALDCIDGKVQKDVNVAFRWLEKTDERFGGKPEPSIPGSVTNIQINNNGTDARTIEATVADILRDALSGNAGRGIHKGEDVAGGSVEKAQ